MVGQLVDATVSEVDTVGYEGLTVRSVARRAGVAPATAYNYFSSKDHLLAEVMWRRLQTLPLPHASPSWGAALDDAVGAMVLLATESPALVDACTVALLSSNQDVKHLRDRIGAVIHRTIAAAMGPGVDPSIVQVLETTFTGALLIAGMGHMRFADIPDFVVGAAELMMRPTDVAR